eukprot:1321716-Rhodomonas_salina.1
MCCCAQGCGGGGCGAFARGCAARLVADGTRTTGAAWQGRVTSTRSAIRALPLRLEWKPSQ